MGRPRAGTLAPIALAALAVSGCGEGDGEQAAPALRPPEKAESVPNLPRGWTELEHAAQGFALGVPPGWRQGGDCLEGGAEAGPATILCSPDKLVTLSVFPDRTNEALELSPGQFAAETMEGLGEEGFERLEPGRPKPFAGRYDGARVTATGEAAGTGVRQDVTVVVLRREGLANFAAVIAANADKPTQPAIRFAERSLRTLRSRPVGPG